MSSPFVWVPLIIAGVVALFIGFFIFQFLNLWVQAFLSGARVSLFSLIGMKLRKVRPDIIVLSRIKSVKAGINLTTNQLESHYLAGGRVPSVVNALIAANRAKINLPFDTACARSTLPVVTSSTP
jgi:uncharacterized protein YqfA (UPF0365 family)